MNAKFQKLYKEISIAFRENKRLLPILLESDKVEFDPIKVLVLKINQFPAAHLFIGKRCVCSNLIEKLILAIKEYTSLPKLLFPRHSSQIEQNGDGIVFSSLPAAQNPDYLIENHLLAVPLLKKLIQKVTDSVKIPVIISRGMGSKERIILAYQFGATMVVIGTAFEINIEFFNLIAND